MYKVVSNIISKNKIKNIIMYDDNYNSFNKFAQDTLLNLTGKVRCFLPALMFSNLVPTHILVLVPPYYEELELAIKNSKNIENFHCWIEDDDVLIDIAKYVKDKNISKYTKLVEKYLSFNRSYVNNGKDDSYSFFVKKITSHLEPTILVIPFETRKWHYYTFSKLIKDKVVQLFSPIDSFIDKVDAANIIIKENSFLSIHYTNPIKINIFNDLNHLLIPNKEGCNIIAKRIIDNCIIIENQRKESYIKLDTKGSDGIDNISPFKYNVIYDGVYSNRIEMLSLFLYKRFKRYDFFPSTPMVEDRIIVDKDKMGFKEYIVSGIFDGKDWSLLSITRAIINNEGTYLGVLGSSIYEDLGLSKMDIGKLKYIVEQSALSMYKHGYRYGYVSKDLILDKRDNQYKVHDHNDRRGGRSFLEQLICLFPNTFFVDKVVELEFKKKINSIKFIQKAYSNSLIDSQHYYVYGTSALYNPEKIEKIKIYIAFSVPSFVIDNGEILDYIDSFELYTQKLFEEFQHEE